MLTPLQISTQRFVPNGKGGYKTADVDAFMQKVYKSYSKLYNDNNALNERLEAVSPMIEEYNKSKAAIANALISAQSVADEKLSKAETQAAIILEAANKNSDEIIASGKAEADRYYHEKTALADTRLRELEAAYEQLKKEADAYRDEYLAKVNVRMEALLAAANEKAASIVANAYNDAKVAKEKSRDVINEANIQLEKIKAETTKVKSELSALILVADSAVKSLNEYAPLAVEDEIQSTAAETISKEDLPEFSLDLKLDDAKQKADISFDAYEEEVAPAVSYEEPEMVDISSDSSFEAPAVSKTEESIDLYSHSSDAQKVQTEMPDVASYLSKIFDETSDEDKDDFGFGDLISESAN